MKNGSKNAKFTLLIMLISLIMIPSLSMDKVWAMTSSSQFQNQSSSYYLPPWIKNNAKWWADGEIGDLDFLKGMEYLIDQGIIIIPATQPVTSGGAQQGGIPSWIKNNAGSWADGKVSDLEFISGIQYMIENEIIQISIIDMGGTLVHHQIALFTPNPTPDLLLMLHDHINSNDMVVSFNTRVLNKYPDVQRILLGYSMDTIQKAVYIAQSNPKPITYIGYDNEADNGNLSTPSIEIQAPGNYTNMAADLVHQAGYKFAVTPTQGLLMQEYKQVDWSKIDLLIMQLQKFTKNQEYFTSTVSQITSYARAENPHILIFVQINPSFDDTSNLASLISRVSNNINGSSIVVINTSPSTVDDLLTKIGR